MTGASFQSGPGFQVEIDDAQVRGILDRLVAAAEDLSPAMDRIGSMLVSSVLHRFETGQGPAGVPWKPSIRARVQGGQTLIDSGRLRASITYIPGPSSVEVGTNAIYAAIHQFGGTIHAKSAPHLTFKIGGRFVSKDHVTIPPRPFLGIDEGDRAEIANILRDHLFKEAA